MLPEGFVYLDEAVPGSLSDAKYAGRDNFVGAPVDGYAAARVVGSRELAEALVKVSEAAHKLNLRLLFWDAYRPQRAVDHFIRWSKEPENGLTKEKHYPGLDRAQLIPLGYIAEKSGHSRGSTIDLTLVDRLSGKELDMGGVFDYFGDISHPDTSSVSPRQHENRMLLRQLMVQCGFRPLSTEWWHFTLENEPYPDTAFDFPVRLP